MASPQLLKRISISFDMGGNFLEHRLATRGLANKESPGRQRPLPDVDVLVPQTRHEEATAKVNTSHPRTVGLLLRFGTEGKDAIR